MTSAEELLKDANRARTQDQAYWENHRRDVQRYIMPYREKAGGHGGKSVGAKRTEHVFDATAVAAAPRGAAKIKRAIMPDHERWFDIVVGPAVTDEAERAARKQSYELTTSLVWAMLSTGSFSAAADDMCLDLYAGDGTMLILPGDGIEHMAIFRCLPTEDVTIDEDEHGRPSRWYYEQELVPEKIESLLKNKRLPADLEKLKKDAPDKTQTVLFHCRKKGPLEYEWQIVWKQGAQILTEAKLRTSPFVTARFYRVPGEKRGRGPAMMALPHVKTLNKTIELQLKAAAFAILGVWAVTDDQLYNSKTTRLRPGGMLKVKSLGRMPAIERLDVPSNFDLSNIMANELRTQIREIMYDDPLPQTGESVRSPTEIIARMRRLSEDIAGAFGRLQHELFIPIIQRCIDILDQFDLLPDFVKLDTYFASLLILSALASTQRLEEVQKVVQFFELLVSMLGPEKALKVMNDERLTEYLRERIGVELSLMNTSEERAAIEEKEAALQMAMVAASSAGMKVPEGAANVGG